MKIYVIILSLFFGILPIFNIDAQEIRVKSFFLQMEPMTVPMQRADNNGNVCALVKVIIPNNEASFEGSLIGKCDYKTSEYWCYLSPGSKHLKIKYPNCEPLMVNFENFIGAGVKSKQIYELKIEIPQASGTIEVFDIAGKITISDISSDSGTFGKLLAFDRLSSGLKLYHNYKNGKYTQMLDSTSLEKGLLDYTLGYSLSNIHIGDSITACLDDSRYEPATIVITKYKLGHGDINLTISKKVISVRCQILDRYTKEPIGKGVELHNAHEQTHNRFPLAVTDANGIAMLNHKIDQSVDIEFQNLPDIYKPSKVYIPSGNSKEQVFYLDRKTHCNWVKLPNDISVDNLKISTDSNNSFISIKLSKYDNKLLCVEYPYNFGINYIEIRCEGYKTIRIYGGLYPSHRPLKMKRGKSSDCIEYRLSDRKIIKTENRID